MPFLEGPFAFTGKLDMLSAYRMRGFDKIIVRRKGGPSREKIKSDPSFKNTRHTMSEFGGCSRLGSYVRLAMHHIKQLSDYNFGSDINSIMRQVQLRDGTGEWGRRKITLSAHARILEGFLTTKKAPSFDSIVRTPVYYTMDRANRSVRVEIPELLRDINYFPQNNHAMFRLTITLGIVPDLNYDIPAKEYLAANWYDPSCYATLASTDWNPSLKGMGSTALELAMETLPPEDGWTLMLAIGIQYGAFRENGKIEEVKRFGAAKILALRGKDEASGDGVDDDGLEEDEVPLVNEAVTEDMPAVEPEEELGEYREPDVRYVYTMKAEKMEARQVETAYSYVVQVAAQDHVDYTLDIAEEHKSKRPSQKSVIVDPIEVNLGNDGVIIFGSFVNFQDFELERPRREVLKVATQSVAVADGWKREVLSRTSVFQV
ncbi:hypothetical protein KK062_14505 [Fulvivirgaceae bacterium PWU5]|uniref:Uncharacterized protein n=1 Tax=Dawidia cretensis TaxID=2782350 RepID=A0AAP2GQA1_9BACT|nr:hypothetical protein [Dawidia cretensis]MBT1709451.1 hypothetical protein [Dawidia cretensis]